LLLISRTIWLVQWSASTAEANSLVEEIFDFRAKNGIFAASSTFFPMSRQEF
jgi:hypothetical protein